MAGGSQLVEGRLVIGISELMRKINGPSEDARFAAWMELYSSKEDAAIREIARIIHAQDPVMKVLLIRFLAHIPEAAAALYLQECLNDDNPIVVEAAKRAFEANLYDDKLPLLLPVLRAHQPSARYFAVESLSLKALPAALDPLLAMLEGADEALLLQLLAGLRHFADKKRVVPAIAPYLKDPREEVRLRALLVIGVYYEAVAPLLRQYLLAALEDPSPRVRRAALWSMRKYPYDKDIPLLLKVSSADPDPAVRAEALLGFVYTPTPAVVGHLVKILVTEKERAVVLKGEAILLSLEKRALTVELDRLLGSADPGIRKKALVLSAEFQRGSEHFYRVLIKGLKAAPTDKERLPFLEALGIFEDPRAVPVLETYLGQSYLLAYAAMSSLLKIGGRVKGLPILKYLENPGFAKPVKQMILTHLIRKGAHYELTDPLVSCLMAFLKDENINIRYLSSQILIRSGRESIVSPLLETVLSETDPTSLQLLQQSIMNFVSVNPRLCLQLIHEHLDNPQTIPFLLSMLLGPHTSGKALLSILPDLLDAPLSLMTSSYKDTCIDLIYRAVLLRQITLAEVIERLGPVSGRELLLAGLAERYGQNTDIPVDIPAATCESLLEGASDLQRDAVLSLMTLSRGRQPVPLLVRVLMDPALQTHHPAAARALEKLMESAA